MCSRSASARPWRSRPSPSRPSRATASPGAESPASGCGKGAANAYCAYLGFGDATDYSKDANIGDKSPTRFIGNSLVCDRKGCDGFKAISCGKKEQPSPEKKKTYDKPRYKGFRLDWCLSKGSGCGKPAADKFCRSEGFDKSSAFAPELRIGIGDPTRMIGSGAICNTVICNGFQSITCVK